VGFRLTKNLGFLLRKVRCEPLFIILGFDFDGLFGRLSPCFLVPNILVGLGT
jgi:hypothetical protein